MKRLLLTAAIAWFGTMTYAQPPQRATPPAIIHIQAPAAPAPAPAPAAAAPAANQPTVIVIQQPQAAPCAPAAKREKSPKSKHNERESCDHLSCMSFRCHFMFQWGSCRSFFGEPRGKDGCRNCEFWP